jgi:predicted NAD/FAD-dependent oxidoreductase
VTVFDKGRSAGGRIATRRLSLPGGLAQFDHGAQFLTVREAEFREALAPLIKKGALQSWSNAGQQDAEAWVGAPGMSALAKALGSGLDVRTSTRITELDRQKAFWRLRGENNATFGPFDWVIVATPAEQAESLFAPVSGMLATEARSASTEPCWAGLFALSCEQAPTPAAIQLHDHAILDWVACDTIKPQRPSAYSCWVAHATPNWSREHLDDSPESVADKLEQAAWAVLAFSARPIVRQAHRWRYARVERPASTPFACDQRARIGACGDWRIGPCIESAWISGDALSRAIAA